MINTNRLVSYSFILLMATLPFPMILAPLALAIFVLMVILDFKRDESLQVPKHNRFFYVFYIYYLLIVVGLFYSYEEGLKYSRIASQLPMLVLPMTISVARLSSNQIQLAKRIFVWSCFLFCLVAFISLGYNFYVNHEHRLNYNFVQRSMYHFHYPYDALYINIAYVFLLTERKLKQYIEIMALVFFIFIFLSGVRIGAFSFLLISIVYFGRNWKTIIKPSFFLKIALLLVVAVVALNSSKYAKDKLFDTLSNLGFGTEEYVSEVGEDYHKMSLRTKLWSSSISLIEEKPLMGYGPNGSQRFLDEKYIENGYGDLKGLNSHNQFLTTTLNHGILGLITLLSIFLLTLKIGVKQKSMQTILCVMVLFLAFMTESVLIRQKGVFLFAIIMSLILKTRMEVHKT
ncbi:O-antigen ligase [Allomuricauda sp. ARW1Y1]|uniref:O-antigen ligase family protein n=1 Tax=Allomuricauda sp. ARW1Y1 TaxID=2663843 RepID=UPI0015CDF188|nr:O-antigen ligase family protein [Muricauda sp. ARW1Y1]NYJ26410.1 O-antigen ligase [Muricauda sp. ARW1Y1]